MTDPISNENQVSSGKPKKTRGGARPNSGRKVGSTVKLSAQALLAEIRKIDVPFEQGLAEDYMKARRGDDRMLVQRYQQMFLSKVIADQVDVTSNGETIGVHLTFAPKNLDDWK